MGLVFQSSRSLRSTIGRNGSSKPLMAFSPGSSLGLLEPPRHDQRRRHVFTAATSTMWWLSIPGVILRRVCRDACALFRRLRCFVSLHAFPAAGGFDERRVSGYGEDDPAREAALAGTTSVCRSRPPVRRMNDPSCSCTRRRVRSRTMGASFRRILTAPQLRGLSESFIAPNFFRTARLAEWTACRCVPGRRIDTK
jgi:hypothetical protein